MRRPVLVSTAMLWAIFFLLAGCGGGGASQAHKGHHAQKSQGATLVALHPEGDSGVGGTATFEDVSKGVQVRLVLHGLPKPAAFYLAHIHPGTCAQGEEENHAGHGVVGSAEEIEWPLMPVKSGTHGDGSSTTTLKRTTTEELFSGRSKHVNVHSAGSGNPPALACANLESSSPAKTAKAATTPQPTSPTPKGASTSSTAAAASASASSRGGGPSEEQAKRLAEADCRLAIHVA